MKTVSFNSLGRTGHLGNQMFQFSALLCIAKINGFQFMLPNPLDIEGDYSLLFETFKLRSVDKNNFGISTFDTFYPDRNDGINFSEQYFKLCKNTNIEGYFQSLKYLQEIDSEVKSNFEFSDDIVVQLNTILKRNELNLQNFSFIHVRRGDYINKKEYHFNLDKSYYKKSINKFSKNEKFIVFTDDVDWSKNNLNLKNREILYFDDFYSNENKVNKSGIELCAMTYCKSGIISNSTFSWWGAYLQKNNGTIVCPNSSSWFGYKYFFKPKDLLREQWIKVNPNIFSLFILKLKRFGNFIKIIFLKIINLFKRYIIKLLKTQT